jgi:hypothetical protein
MSEKLLTALGELQDRLRKLESAATTLAHARQAMEMNTAAARQVTEAAAEVVLRAKEMRDATAAIAALPPLVESLKGAILEESNKLLREVSASAQMQLQVMRQENSVCQTTVRQSAKEIMENDSALAVRIERAHAEVVRQESTACQTAVRQTAIEATDNVTALAGHIERTQAEALDRAANRLTKAVSEAEVRMIAKISPQLASISKRTTWAAILAGMAFLGMALIALMLLL